MPIADQEAVDADWNSLRSFASKVEQGSILRQIFDETIALRDRVLIWEHFPQPAGTGGSASRLFENRDDGKCRYWVQYSREIGTLVHEMTHVAVNERYGRDFVNYESPGRDLAAPEYSKVPSGLLKYRLGDLSAKQFGHLFVMTNELERQESWYDADCHSKLMSELKKIKKQAKNVTFDEAFVRPNPEGPSVALEFNINNRLVDLEAVLSTEYDTRINQILVWLYAWKQSDENWDKRKQSLYVSVEKAAGNAHERRRSARAPDRQPVVPSSQGTGVLVAPTDFPDKVPTNFPH